MAQIHGVKDPHRCDVKKGVHMYMSPKGVQGASRQRQSAKTESLWTKWLRIAHVGVRVWGMACAVYTGLSLGD
jgi:hypothetical protein